MNRQIHIVWVGDETQRPDTCIDSWSRLNPQFEVRVWGNKDLKTHKWINAKHIKSMWDHELCGVADLMRYEILYEYGGLAIDADAVCIRPLEDWLLTAGDFACWSNEHHAPGMVANGYMGAAQSSELLGAVISNLADTASVTTDRAWITTGPILLTNVWHAQSAPLTVWPSYFFIPEHHSGPAYTGTGPIFARQLYASTRQAYTRLTEFDMPALERELDTLRR